jgi:hypothetical protein
MLAFVSDVEEFKTIKENFSSAGKRNKSSKKVNRAPSKVHVAKIAKYIYFVPNDFIKKLWVSVSIIFEIFNNSHQFAIKNKSYFHKLLNLLS